MVAMNQNQTGVALRTVEDVRGVNPTRARPAVRAMYDRPMLLPADLAAPLLVVPDHHGDSSAAALPGVVTIASVAATVGGWAEAGIRAVKIFVRGHPRDARASAGTSPGNLMIRAIRQVKATAPMMVVTTEVCGCSWTDHGECALLNDTGQVDLTSTYALMAEMAVGHAEAGADVVSPTAMIEGSVHAVRLALNAHGHRDVGVNPNIAIHSSLFGAFKSVMGTNPGRGHRRGFQLEPLSAHRGAVAQAEQWLTEGADSLTVQPVLSALDVLVRLRQSTHAPLVAYSTSGEYTGLAALRIDGLVEYFGSLRRAGADLVLTFAAGEIARHLTS